MGTHKRTARRFQVEALEGRWAPGAGTGIGGDLLQAHVDPTQAHVEPLGGRVGGGGEIAPTPCGGRGGIGGEV